MGECNFLFQDLLTRARIQFDTGSATIAPESFGLLDRLVVVVRRCEGAKVEIAGHTDSVGSADSNLALSEARAKSVVDYLAQSGIAGERVEARGYGANGRLPRTRRPRGGRRTAESSSRCSEERGMVYLIGQFWLWLLAAFALGLAVGWFTFRGRDGAFLARIDPLGRAPWCGHPDRRRAFFPGRSGILGRSRHAARRVLFHRLLPGGCLEGQAAVETAQPARRSSRLCRCPHPLLLIPHPLLRPFP